MTRDQQKLIKDLNKRMKTELKVLCRSHNFQFAYGIIYRFDDNFVYTVILDINQTYCDDISVSILIKPWVLNETYWKVQKINDEEVSSQPTTFHFRGAFTINDIKYEAYRIGYSKDNFSISLENTLKGIDKRISDHQSILKNVNLLLNGTNEYNVSNLCKAIICIYNKDFTKALIYLNDNTEKADSDVYVHSYNGKSAQEYAIEYCKEKLNYEVI